MPSPSERDLIARLANELEDISRTTCWRGNFAACDNGGCVHRRALIAEARAALALADALTTTTEDR